MKYNQLESILTVGRIYSTDYLTTSFCRYDILAKECLFLFCNVYSARTVRTN